MIYIVPDSNILYVPFDKTKAPVYDQFDLKQSFKDLIALQTPDICYDSVQILVPEMVLKELVEQKTAQYGKDTEEYNALAIRMGIPEKQFESVNLYRDKALEQAKLFLHEKSVDVIPVCDARYWVHIVNKAVRKEAPFEGAGGKADKGFKDTVIFFSIVEYAQEHKGSYYFVSKDGIFSRKDKTGNIGRLQQEFFDWSGSSLHVVSEINELKRRIVRTEPGQVLDKLEYTIRKQEFKIDRDSSKIPIQVTQEIPTFIEDNAVGAMLNEEISSQWRSFIASWQTFITEREPWNANMIYNGSFVVDVTYNANSKISVRFYEYQFVGGVHGSSTIYAYTYNLKEAKLLTLTEVLGLDAESALKLVNQCVDCDIKNSRAGKYFNETANITDLENIVFYISDGMVHIVFNEYYLGPYASGIIDLILYDFKMN